MAIGCSISWPGMLPAAASGTSARPVAEAVMRIGARRSFAPRSTSAGPERLAFVPLEMLEVADHQDAVACGDPEDGEEADERAEREHAVAEPHGEHASDERHRQQQEGEDCETQAAEGGL